MRLAVTKPKVRHEPKTGMFENFGNIAAPPHIVPQSPAPWQQQPDPPEQHELMRSLAARVRVLANSAATAAAPGELSNDV